jgi:hypothetical protein
MLSLYTHTHTVYRVNRLQNCSGIWCYKPSTYKNETRVHMSVYSFAVTLYSDVFAYKTENCVYFVRRYFKKPVVYY